MQAKIAIFMLKQAVKYLKKHPDLIPGDVDNLLIVCIAAALGV